MTHIRHTNLRSRNESGQAKQAISEAAVDGAGQHSGTTQSSDWLAERKVKPQSDNPLTNQGDGVELPPTQRSQALESKRGQR